MDVIHGYNCIPYSTGLYTNEPCQHQGTVRYTRAYFVMYTQCVYVSNALRDTCFSSTPLVQAFWMRWILLVTMDMFTRGVKTGPFLPLGRYVTIATGSCFLQSSRLLVHITVLLFFSIFFVLFHSQDREVFHGQEPCVSPVLLPPHFSTHSR